MLRLISRRLPLTSRTLSECKEIKARRQAGVEAVEGRGYEPCEAASHIGVRLYIMACGRYVEFFNQKTIMEITFDTNKNTVRVNGKYYAFNSFNDSAAIDLLKKFIRANTKLDSYEEDSMWMSYRYCIGRHTIATHMRANDIAKRCYGRLSNERSIFTAYDINNEIEDCMKYGCGPRWSFPCTSLNAIYTSAIDIYCQFVEDFEIKTIDDLLKYKEVKVILADNERGYKIESVTWEEYLRAQVHKIVNDWFAGQNIDEDDAWGYYQQWEEDNAKENEEDVFNEKFKLISKDKISKKMYFSLSSIEDLFVWNNLVHLFDVEHHHKSVLTNGKEVEWYWTYVPDWTKENEISYRRVRVPVDSSVDNVEILTNITEDDK